MIKNNNYPSLFDAFSLGDRVIRKYRGENGKLKEYRGVILSIEDDCMEVYWDTLNGKYRPDNMKITFSNLKINEIFNGNDKFTPIRKNK